MSESNNEPATDSAPSYASMSMQDRIDGYNAKNSSLLADFGLTLASEAYLDGGLIKSRPVLFPVEQLKKLDE